MEEEGTGEEEEATGGVEVEGERSGEGKQEGQEQLGARTVKSVWSSTLHVATFGTVIEEVGQMETSVWVETLKVT